MTRKYILVAVVMAVALALVGCSGAAEPAPDATQTPSTEAPAATEPSGAEQLVQTKCSMCHDLSRVEGADYDQAKWEETVTRMQQNGLVVTDAERQEIIDYLVAQDAAP